jgi:hypothetical protein
MRSSTRKVVLLQVLQSQCIKWISRHVHVHAQIICFKRVESSAAVETPRKHETIRVPSGSLPIAKGMFLSPIILFNHQVCITHCQRHSAENIICMTPKSSDQRHDAFSPGGGPYYDMKTFLKDENAQVAPVRGHVTIPPFFAAISSKAYNGDQPRLSARYANLPLWSKHDHLEKPSACYLHP